MKSTVSRRGFLKTVSALAGGAAIGAPRFLKAADAGDKYGGFLMGIQSYSLRNFPVDRMLQITHDDLGLHQVEFFGAHFPLNANDEKIKSIEDQMAKLEIKSLAHGVNAFTKDDKANRKIFEFAKKAGIKNLSADPSPDAFDSLDKLVEEFDIRIAIHNHGPGAIQQSGGRAERHRRASQKHRRVRRFGPLHSLGGRSGEGHQFAQRPVVRSAPEGFRGNERKCERSDTRQRPARCGRRLQGPAQSKLSCGLQPGAGVRGEARKPDCRHSGMPGGGGRRGAKGGKKLRFRAGNRSKVPRIVD